MREYPIATSEDIDIIWNYECSDEVLKSAFYQRFTMSPNLLVRGSGATVYFIYSKTEFGIRKLNHRDFQSFRVRMRKMLLFLQHPDYDPYAMGVVDTSTSLLHQIAGQPKNEHVRNYLYYFYKPTKSFQNDPRYATLRDCSGCPQSATVKQLMDAEPEVWRTTLDHISTDQLRVREAREEFEAGQKLGETPVKLVTRLFKHAEACHVLYAKWDLYHLARAPYLAWAMDRAKTEANRRPKTGLQKAKQFLFRPAALPIPDGWSVAHHDALFNLPWDWELREVDETALRRARRALPEEAAMPLATMIEATNTGAAAGAGADPKQYQQWCQTHTA